jgi:hypothetical protein
LDFGGYSGGGGPGSWLAQSELDREYRDSAPEGKVAGRPIYVDPHGRERAQEDDEDSGEVPQSMPRWNIEGVEGGSDKSYRWRAERGGSAMAWLGAVVFVVILGSLPVVLANSYKMVTRTQIIESICLYVWLLGGLYMFTQVVIFQSPHFETPRHLVIEEACYLFAQILTTVGYGDITPARTRGQLAVALFVLVSVLVISNMITELLEFFQDVIESRMEKEEDKMEASDAEVREPEAKQDDTAMLKAAFAPVIETSIVFCMFVAAGSAFFVFWPGEGKDPHQGVYMALITMSTVGFGAFTPTTHTGMVFGAFWMVCGCSSLMAVITSRGAFSLALKHYEIRRMIAEDLKNAKATDADYAAAAELGMSRDALPGSEPKLAENKQNRT